MRPQHQLQTVAPPDTITSVGSAAPAQPDPFPATLLPRSLVSASELVYLIVDGLEQETIQHAYASREAIGGFKIMPGIPLAANLDIHEYFGVEPPTAVVELYTNTNPPRAIYPLFCAPLPARFRIDWIAPEREHPDGLGIVATVQGLIDYSKKFAGGLTIKRLPDGLIQRGDRVKISYCPSNGTGGLIPIATKGFVATSRSRIEHIRHGDGRSIYLADRLADTHPVSSAVDVIAQGAGAHCGSCPYYTDAHPTA